MGLPDLNLHIEWLGNLGNPFSFRILKIALNGVNREMPKDSKLKL